MKKLSYLLITVFIVMCLPLNVLGATTFDGGDGTIDNPYLISTLDQLKAIADNMSAHYKLTQNITNELTAPIGGMETANIPTFAGTAFTGSLDGNGKFVTLNMSFSKLSGQKNTFRASLFPVVGKGAVIKDLTIKGAVASQFMPAGLISEVVAEGGTVTIANVKNEATVSSWFEVGGGIIASVVSGNVVVTNCENHGEIKLGRNTKGHYGGIIGSAADVVTGEIKDSKNYGALTHYNTTEKNNILDCVGGIIGSNATGDFKISDCYNYGSINAVSRTQVGGIAGWSVSSISTSANFGDIIGGSQTGGIAGYGQGPISKCYNFGNIGSAVANAPIGGIVGKTRSSYTTNAITDSFNAGKVAGIDDTVVLPGTIAGINHLNTSGKRGGHLIKRCYDISLGDAPLYNTTATGSDNIISDNFVLSENPQSETELSGVTFVTLSELRELPAGLGANYKISTPTEQNPFNLPQIAGNEVSYDYAIYSVTLTPGANGSFDKTGAKYVKRNDTFSVTVTPDNEYYMTELKYNGETVCENQISSYAYTTPQIKGDAEITATFATYRANPEITSNPAVFATNEDIALDGEVYTGVKVVAFSRVLDAYAHSLVEYGMIFAKEDNDSILTYADGIKAVALKMSDSGCYGILFYGNGLLEDTDYYAKPYAKFVKEGASEPVIIYGDKITMHTNAE